MAYRLAGFSDGGKAVVFSDERHCGVRCGV
jgi:hypothetical protein